MVREEIYSLSNIGLVREFKIYEKAINKTRKYKADVVKNIR